MDRVEAGETNESIVEYLDTSNVLVFIAAHLWFNK